jgi:pSer/pThr/pTyr-binding forkhead associated (FHA) protein
MSKGHSGIQVASSAVSAACLPTLNVVLSSSTGRTSSAAIRHQTWVDVPGMSRLHARITIDGSAVLLEDLGRKNGTTVGETLVEAAVSLRDGDWIRFGSVAGVYRTSSAGRSTETHSPLSRRKRRT